jgi:ribosomal protein L10
MSKYVKELLSQHVKDRLSGVEDLVVVNVIGLTANSTTKLRKQLRDERLSLLVVKNSLARRATEGTVLAPAFEDLTGCAAVLWGGDIVALAKRVIQLRQDPDYEKLEARGGVMDGSPLTAEDVVNVSKWPSREEQLSLLLGQILSPGGRLASQLTGVGAALASQIKQKSEEETTTAAGEAADAAPAG